MISTDLFKLFEPDLLEYFEERAVDLSSKIGRCVDIDDWQRIDSSVSFSTSIADMRVMVMSHFSIFKR